MSDKEYQMEKNKTFKRRGRRKTVSFDPSREFISSSVEEFLKQGGRITRIERVNGSYQNFVAISDALSSADDFLFDR